MGIVEVAKPKAGPGEIVLKVHDCGICGSDLHACQYGIGLRPDSIMGHEFCGEVHEIGAGARALPRESEWQACPSFRAVPAIAVSAECRFIATT
jgi:threonine dehydrogenase-like Zn-dependent dehydrogenase